MRGQKLNQCSDILATVLIVIVCAGFAQGALTEFDLWPAAMGLAVDNSGRIWISNWCGDSVLGFYENAPLSDQDVLVVPKCENPRCVTLGPLGTTGYAASWDNYHSGDVVVFGLANGEIQQVLKNGPDDCHFNAAVGPDESWLYFANYYAGTVTQMSVPDDAVMADVYVGPWPARAKLTSDGRYLYVIYNAWGPPGGDGLRVVDTSTNTALPPLTLPAGVHDLAFSTDQTKLYLTASGPESGGWVYVLDTSAPSAPYLVDTVDIEGNPWSIAVCDSIAAVGLYDGRICFINLRCGDNNVIGYEGTPIVPVHQYTILQDGAIRDGKAYFANCDRNTVMIADLPPCGVVVPYQESFEPDPGWLTNNPGRFFVDGGTLVGIGVTDANEYCTTPVSAHPAGMLLEWDSYLVSSDWSGALGFGLYDCRRWADPQEADQLLRVAYAHDDDGYMVLLSAEDAEGHVRDNEMYVDVRGKWVHNVLSYRADQDLVAYAVAHDGQTLASAQLPGITGFTDVLCQLGFSLVHDCAVGGQTTIVKVDNVVYREWGSWDSGLDELAAASAHREVVNFPNPFNPSTTISFSSTTDGHAEVAVYDASGRLVRRLVDSTIEAGEHTVPWDGRDEEGREVASGVYLYRVQAPGVSQERKMALLK
jgi:DNA-binding beta-propeller fold protein YncE